MPDKPIFDVFCHHCKKDIPCSMPVFQRLPHDHWCDQRVAYYDKHGKGNPVDDFFPKIAGTPYYITQIRVRKTNPDISKPQNLPTLELVTELGSCFITPLASRPAAF
jgi:hypothetical protein